MHSYSHQLLHKLLHQPKLALIAALTVAYSLEMQVQSMLRAVKNFEWFFDMPAGTATPAQVPFCTLCHAF